MTHADTASTHTNSEGERLSIKWGELRGDPVQLLCIHDDPPPRGSGIEAITLLDEGTRNWLRQVTS